MKTFVETVEEDSKKISEKDKPKEKVPITVQGKQTRLSRWFRFFSCQKQASTLKDSVDEESTPWPKSWEPSTYEDTVPFVPPIQGGWVVKVYDGDTITIANRLPYEESPLYRFRVRLAGIDSPEINGSSALEKTKAIRSRKLLEDLILGRWVTLKNSKTEKYGRLLADVYLGQLHVNQWLITSGLAVKYDGGAKNPHK